MFQFSKVYSMNSDVLRKQTHLGNLNVFNDVKCSICKQKGHNKLFCINTEIPRLVDELVEKIDSLKNADSVPCQFLSIPAQSAWVQKLNMFVMDSPGSSGHIILTELLKVAYLNLLIFALL